MSELTQGPTEILTHEEYLRRRAQGGSHETPSIRWAVAEIDRLREFEAREAAVTNFFAGIVDFGDGKLTEEQFLRLMEAHDSVLCSAIEALGRRDKIRKLEGALEVWREIKLQLEVVGEVDTFIRVVAFTKLREMQHQEELSLARAGK